MTNYERPSDKVTENFAEGYFALAMQIANGTHFVSVKTVDGKREVSILAIDQDALNQLSKQRFVL